MSVHKNRVGGWDVRWRENGKARSRSFTDKLEAEAFDVTVKRPKRAGQADRLDAGRETLDAYVADVWIPVHVATLAPKTADLYAALYDRHVSPHLGRHELRQLTPEVIGRWQSDRIAAGAPVESTRKALTLIGNILQRAHESDRIPSNPQRLVRRVAPPPFDEVRPLVPVTVEAIRARLRPRDRMIVGLLAYARLRPQELRGLRWGHVGERTVTVHAPKTRRHRQQPRSVRLLAPLAQDLREWRLASGRPGDDAPVIPAQGGGHWTEVGYEQWITRV